jgi:diguanylate cyclase (GGDEF)-like protein
MTETAPRILIVEDNEDDAFLLQMELGRVAADAQFQRVDSQEGLRRALLEGVWDLVICDHSMPQFDSDRALRITQELAGDLPFVIYSGHIDEGNALEALRCGAQDFIDKHDPARLLPVVERELRNSTMRRAKREADSSLVRLSNYDSLTRLPNRRSLEEVMGAALAHAGAQDLCPALLVLDLDRFMRINDSFGYDVGDQLMRDVAARLQEGAGTGAYVARLGEDEFAVFLPRNRDPANGVAAGERIERAFAHPFQLQGQDQYVSFSIGLARYPDHGRDPATLLKNAESAMFRAKVRGGSRIQIYDRGISHSVGYRLKLENALRGVIARKELSLLYQPIVDLASGRVVATEALVRWSHPEFGTVLPDQFIPLAEEVGLIIEIGEWVLLEACTQTQRWREAGHAGLKVAVNISAEQFHDPAIAERIPLVLAQSGLDPAALELEITESVAMRDAAPAVAILKALKAHGVKIAIDDFGTGFSSLSYLKRFPIDILKIDKSFVRALPEGEEDAAIVRMIAALGHTLGLTLHAEGIETEAQRDFLVKVGCHRAQGYAIAKPLVAAALEAFLVAPAPRTPGSRGGSVLESKRAPAS